MACRQQSTQVRDPPWLWNPGEMSSEVQNRGTSGPTKRTHVLQKLKKKSIIKSSCLESRARSNFFSLDLDPIFLNLDLDPDQIFPSLDPSLIFSNLDLNKEPRSQSYSSECRSRSGSNFSEFRSYFSQSKSRPRFFQFCKVIRIRITLDRVNV